MIILKIIFTAQKSVDNINVLTIVLDGKSSKHC